MTSKQIKAKLSIMDVLTHFGKLPRRAKPRRWAFSIPCPFHRDSNPSFRVYPDNQSFTCFAGCGAGDVFTLIGLCLGTDHFPSITATAEAIVISRYGGDALSELLGDKPTTVVEPSPEGDDWTRFLTVRLPAPGRRAQRRLLRKLCRIWHTSEKYLTEARIHPNHTEAPNHVNHTSYTEHTKRRNHTGHTEPKSVNEQEFAVRADREQYIGNKQDLDTPVSIDRKQDGDVPEQGERGYEEARERRRDYDCRPGGARIIQKESQKQRDTNRIIRAASTPGRPHAGSGTARVTSPVVAKIDSPARSTLLVGHRTRAFIGKTPTIWPKKAPFSLSARLWGKTESALAESLVADALQQVTQKLSRATRRIRWELTIKAANLTQSAAIRTLIEHKVMGPSYGELAAKLSRNVQSVVSSICGEFDG